MEPPDDRNVVLTGFMGTGKSTIGSRLAERLGFDFVDTDELITSRHGSIVQIFEELGEGAFRRLEREVAAELAGRSRLVVATGGRMMVDADNAGRLGASGHVVALTATLDTVFERVGGDDAGLHRPMLAGDDVRARLAALMAERADAYARFDQVATDDRTPDEIVTAIVDLLGGRGRRPGG